MEDGWFIIMLLGGVFVVILFIFFIGLGISNFPSFMENNFCHTPVVAEAGK